MVEKTEKKEKMKQIHAPVDIKTWGLLDEEVHRRKMAGMKDYGRGEIVKEMVAKYLPHKDKKGGKND